MAYIKKKQGWDIRERKCVRVNRKLFTGNLKKRLLLAAVLMIGLLAVINSCGAAVSEAAEEQETFGGTMLRSLAEEVEARLYSQFLPGIAFTEENGSHETYWLLQKQIDSLLPLYGYMTKGVTKEGETALDFRTILLAEAEEETYLQEELPQNSLTETELQREQQDSVVEVFPEQPTGEGDSSLEEVKGETIDDLLRAENEAALQMQFSSFIPHGQQQQVSLEPLKEYETLIRQFYSVDANTSVGSDRLEISKLLEADMTVAKDSPGPQILIYHTHSQEAFSDSVPGDASTTIMGVGDRLTEILTLDYGYEVLHHRGQYDVESRDNAYGNALTEIQQVLKDNPSIQVVIDLHRDAMPEGTRLVMDLDGRPTARFMFFNGLSRTKKTGNIAYLYNENLDSNLAFSFQMQLKAMEYYPGLTRKIYLKGYRYNMHLCPKYLLIELGAQNNTVEEAMNACDPLAHILDMVLSGS